MSAGSHVGLAHPEMVDRKVHAFVTVFREPAAQHEGAPCDAVLVKRRNGSAYSTDDDIWLLPDEAEEMAAKLLMAAAAVRARLAAHDARSST